MRKVFEAVVEWASEDGGKALVAVVGDEDAIGTNESGVPESGCGMYVRLHSWDEAKAHAEAQALAGKRVRVTVEVVG